MNTNRNNQAFCIHCTLPLPVCICAQAPELKLDSNTHLLFHPNEPQKRSSSGRLLKHCLGINSTMWHRNKNNELEAKFQGYALLYPDQNSSQMKPQTKIKGAISYTQHQSSSPISATGYLWLDATWQQSKKILRQSPWLDALPKYSISAHLLHTLPTSQYSLRRNQTPEGLSTMETFAYWLYEQNQPNQAQDLLNFFKQFQIAYIKARDAGLFK